MKTTVVRKTSYEKPYLEQITSNRRWKRNSKRYQTVQRRHVGIIRLQWFVFAYKNDYAQFNGMRWIGDENWSVRCAVLMGLLEDEDYITGLILTGLEGIKTMNILSFTSLAKKTKLGLMGQKHLANYSRLTPQ